MRKDWVLSAGLCPCILFGYRSYTNEATLEDSDGDKEFVELIDHTLYLGPFVIIVTVWDV